MTDDNRDHNPDIPATEPDPRGPAGRPVRARGALDDIPDNSETVAVSSGPLSEEAAAFEEEVLAGLARFDEENAARRAELTAARLFEREEDPAPEETPEDVPEEEDGADAQPDLAEPSEEPEDETSEDSTDEPETETDDEPETEEDEDIFTPADIGDTAPARRAPRVSRLLFWLVLVSSLIVAAGGTVLKYTACKKAGILQDKFAMAIPFILWDDKALQKEIRMAYEPTTEAPPTETAPPSTAAPTVAPSTAAPTTEAPTQEQHWALAQVDEAYWKDVLFIGDSRTEGLKLYAPLDGAVYYCASSLGPYDILEDTTKISVKVNGAVSEMTLDEILQAREYHAVYVMLGINDIGHSMDGLEMMFSRLIDRIREYLPDVPIVLQANLRVTDRMVNVDEYFTAERFTAFEGVLQSLADGETIFYIDVNPLFCNEEGYLIDEYTKDGSHPYAAHYAEWREFLMQNGVVLE